MYNIEDLINEYGNEYLMETDPDVALYSMYDLNELLPQSPEDAFSAGLNAYGYFGGEKYKRDFNLNDDYFTYDGYARLVSVYGSDYIPYLQGHIDEDYFIEWCEEQGYIDEDEDYEDED